MRRYEPIRRDALAAISCKITIECAGLQIPDRRLDPDTGGFPVGRQLCFKQRFIQAPQNDTWQAVAEDANRWPSQGGAVPGKKDLQEWVMEAIESLGGGGTVVEVTQEVWRRHEKDLREAGGLFYTWQYDICWAAQALRDDGKLMGAEQAPRGVWVFAVPERQ